MTAALALILGGFSHVFAQERPQAWVELEDRAGRSIEAHVLSVDEDHVRFVTREEGRVRTAELDSISPRTRFLLDPRASRTVHMERPSGRDLPNLIYNPSFEDVDTLRATYAEHWMDRDFWSREKADARSGDYVLQATGPASGYTFQDLDLIPGQRYHVRFFVKGGARGDAGARIRIGDADSGWSGASRGWKPMGFDFTAKQVNESLRLDIELPEGATLSVDDVSLRPADGKVPQAPAPTILTEGGDHVGPLHVKIENPMPEATVRYTIDGSDPHEFSTPYTIPFILHGPAEVRAATFKGSHARSEVVTQSYNILPKLGDGVPFYPVGWGQPVDQWWAEHIHNPDSPNYYNSPITSPEPRINVAEVRAQHPESETAGIEEALALLPESGGTLWFPKSGSPYTVTREPREIKNYYFLDATIMVLRRSNIHFLSDGATIQATHKKSEGSGHPGLFAFCSMEYADTGEFQNPVRNFYFKGLTFDGTNTGAPSAFLFRHCADVLFEDCKFINFKNPTNRYHPGLVNATSMTDNIWMKDCQLMDGKFGVYWDGVHNGGFVNCTFGKGLVESAILLLCNNDMVHYSAAQRTCQYIAVDGNRFYSAGEDVMTATAANVLLKDNMAMGRYVHFLEQVGRGRSNMRPFTRYNGGGFRVLGNRVEHAEMFISFRGDNAQFTRHEQFEMDNVVARNVVKSVDRMLYAAPRTPFDFIENITLRNNRFGGESPKIVLDGRGLDRMHNIAFYDNVLQDSDELTIVESQGRPITEPVIRTWRLDEAPATRRESP